MPRPAIRHDNSAATNLTLSEAARAQLAGGTASKDFTTVTSEARAALDALYAAAKVTGPIGADGKTTIDLSSLDRRSLFAVATNNGGKFSPDEQKAAATELGNRFDNVLAPPAATSKLTGDFVLALQGSARLSRRRQQRGEGHGDVVGAAGGGA